MFMLVFIDGHWVSQSMTRNTFSEFDQGITKFVDQSPFSSNWAQIQHLIGTNLNNQFKAKRSVRTVVDILKSSVYMNNPLTPAHAKHVDNLCSDFYGANMDVYRDRSASSDKTESVVSLASDMLYQSATNALDVAVILTGDKSFISLLEKVRLLPKKVAICSLRNSCSPLLIAPQSRLSDFDTIWLDDYFSEFILKDSPSKDKQSELISDPMVENNHEILRIIIQVNKFIF
jgi:uncharacterized LabA/DUF88 family protein